MGGSRPRVAAASSPLFNFTGVPVSKADTLIVPPGYVADVLYAWGDPTSEGPPFKPDASDTAEAQNFYRRLRRSSGKAAARRLSEAARGRCMSRTRW